jgi:hypothetical protein
MLRASSWPRGFSAKRYKLSTGRVIPVRWIGEQHIREDLGFIPSFADWVKAIRPEPWMGRAFKLDGGEPQAGDLLDLNSDLEPCILPLPGML